MYGPDPDDVLAGGMLDWTRGVPSTPPPRQATAASAQDGGAGLDDGEMASATALETDKGAHGAWKTATAVATPAAGATPVAAVNDKAPGQSPFESRIADVEAGLPEGTAEGMRTGKGSARREVPDQAQDASGDLRGKGKGPKALDWSHSVEGGF